MANAFDGVPAADMKNLDIFDLKGSLDNRHQRTEGGVLMGFDLLMADRKLVPASADEGKELLAQVERDTAMLVKQKMSFDPYGFDEDMHSPGLMDYSLLVGVAPLGTPGGLISLKMRDERTVYHNDVEHGWKSGWQVESTDVVVSVGIIDILQFWNTKKRIARYMKKLVGKERDDDGKYKGGMLDSVQPEVYQQRFIRFVDQVFASGSWLESLPKMYENNWGYVPLRQIHQLPDPQRSKAEMQHTAAYRTLKWSARTHPASGCNIPETIASCFCCGRKLSGEDEKEGYRMRGIAHVPEPPLHPRADRPGRRPNRREGVRSADTNEHTSAGEATQTMRAVAPARNVELTARLSPVEVAQEVDVDIVLQRRRSVTKRGRDFFQWSFRRPTQARSSTPQPRSQMGS